MSALEEHSIYADGPPCNLCGLDKRIAALEKQLLEAQQGEAVEQYVRKESEEYAKMLEAEVERLAIVGTALTVVQRIR